MFPALVLDKTDGFRAEVREIDEDLLSEGDVTVAIAHSTLNYKDALAITNRGPVVRRWPMVAGIDGAGTVLASGHPGWIAGDKVVLNGWGVGEGHTGCLASRARLRGEWLVALPEVFSTRQAMAIGTAGYTAMLCVMALERHGLAPGDGEVLVTGATGGVGSEMCIRDRSITAAQRSFCSGLPAVLTSDRSITPCAPSRSRSVSYTHLTLPTKA